MKIYLVDGVANVTLDLDPTWPMYRHMSISDQPLHYKIKLFPFVFEWDETEGGS